MMLNDLLRAAGLDLSRVLVLRHTPTEGRLFRALRNLATARPELYNAYQQTQRPAVERKMASAECVASFVGDKVGRAVFAGIFLNAGSVPLTRDAYWKNPLNVELRNRYGMKGFSADKPRKTILWFDLRPTAIYGQLRDNLIIEWRKKDARHWARFANKRDWSILSGRDVTTELVSAAAVSGNLPGRSLAEIYRVKRDTAKALNVKRWHNYDCQVRGCDATILTPGGRYAEAHHIQPLGGENRGLDCEENLLCLCPNHHAEFDFATREFSIESLRTVPEHQIGQEFIDHHNARVLERRKQAAAGSATQS